MSFEARRVLVSDLKAVAYTLSHHELISLSGIIYTARDATHKRLVESIAKCESLPFCIDGAVIYYCGPTPVNPCAQGAARVLGSCGPTSSYRMDTFTPQLYDMGLAATIGKGPRSAAVMESIRKNGALYLTAVGGAGALYSSCVKSACVIAYPELGCEAVMQLEVCEMRVFVIKE